MDNFKLIKQKALHTAYSIRALNLPLTRFDNFLRFIGIGIAPALIIGAAYSNNKPILIISIIIASFLSLGNWTWTIASLIFNKNRHIDICKTIPVKIELFIHTIEKDLNNNNLNNKIIELNHFYLQIKAEIEREHFSIPDWVNVSSQQRILSEENATCSSCNQSWKSKRYLNKKEIKSILSNKKKYNNYCNICGQKKLKE